MKPELAILDQLNFEELERLLQEAFSDRDANVKVPNHVALKQKYLSAPIPGKLAVVKNNSEIVAMNGLLPYMLNVSGIQKRVWLSCDTATNSQHRGKGLFKSCVQELENSLEQGDLILGFPNANSLPGFLKQGWEIISEIKIFVAPKSLFCPKNLKIRKILPEKISEDFLGFGDFIKSKEYLNWRYSRLRDDYQIFEINLNEKLYIVVTKVMKIKKISFTVILDIFTSKSKIDANLIKSLKYLATKQKTIGILTSSFGLDRKTLISNFLLRVPNILNSRRIFLAGKVLGDTNVNLQSSIKELTLGDFDAI